MVLEENRSLELMEDSEGKEMGGEILSDKRERGREWLAELEWGESRERHKRDGHFSWQVAKTLIEVRTKGQNCDRVFLTFVLFCVFKVLYQALLKLGWRGVGRAK